MKKFVKLFALLFITSSLHGQNSEVDRLIKSELTMNFPAIYFKHNSTDYAVMPYSADSCFNYIAVHIKDINDLVIWRDSLETEKLTTQRIKKLKSVLNNHKETRGIPIKSMNKQQKISRPIINQTSDSTRINYLLCLNSVFEISKTQIPVKTATTSHWFHLPCWLNPRFNRMGREHCRMEKRIRKQERAKK